MDDLIFHVVGAGRVGKALARLLQEKTVLRLACVVGRNSMQAQAAVAWLGAGQGAVLGEPLPAADVLLIATPDDALAAVALQLAQTVCPKPGALAFHVSGVMPASILVPLAEQGWQIASVHPALSFPDSALAVERFAGTVCALEGDPTALARLTLWFSALGARPFVLDAAGKTHYHAAQVIASNYAVSLVDFAYRTMSDAGVAPALARALLEPLASQSLANAFALGPQAALTGPIRRGDDGTVARHLAVLRGDDACAYRALGRQALQLAHEMLTPAQETRLAALLGEGSA